MKCKEGILFLELMFIFFIVNDLPILSEQGPCN